MSALSPPAKPDLTALRESLRTLEGRRGKLVLPFGVDGIDARLPDGGLAHGAIHEVTGHAQGAVDGAAAALFCAGIAARTAGPVMWYVTQPDLFAPALAQAGLTPDRLIVVRTRNETDLLAAYEEGLRHGSLTAAVAEVGPLSMLASRRLQLAAEAGGTLGLILRRWNTAKLAVQFHHPTTACTRWRVHSLPAAPLPVEGVGRPRWRLDLLRAKGGNPAEFEVEACDAQGRLQDCLAVSALLAKRLPQSTTAHERKRAAS